MFPARYDRYIEVFGGGGWVLFGRPPDGKVMEVYNDFNSNLANLYACVKGQTWEFLRDLGFLPLNSWDEFGVIRQFLDKGEFDAPFMARELELAEHNLPAPEFEDIRSLMLENASPGDVRRAVAFYKLIRYSYGSGCTSYGCQPFDVRKTFSLIWEASRRLANTVIENKDFEALIRQYDRESAFIYCDPPYYQAECYEVEFPREDHVRLHDALARCKGLVMVSYNYCPFICELYQDFYIFHTTRANSMSQTAGSEYEEVVMTNYDPRAYAAARSEQITLFQLEDDIPGEGGQYTLIHEPNIKTKEDET